MRDLQRPIDPAGRVPGTIGIAYAVYHHWRSGPPRGTIVAQEGGPGLSSVRSFSSYHALYEPLLGDRDLIVVDARGTGNSGAIDCKPMQGAWKITIENAGACGASLGAAADYYGTGLAVEDMIAVLDHLGVKRFDYYGDSYGTFFGQTLAARYPGRLRSVVLDGAYPVIGESPWYPARRRGDAAHDQSRLRALGLLRRPARLLARSCDGARPVDTRQDHQRPCAGRQWRHPHTSPPIQRRWD